MSKTKTITKENFDAVRTMRAICDQTGKEIMKLTFVEEEACLKELLSKEGSKSS